MYFLIMYHLQQMHALIDRFLESLTLDRGSAPLTISAYHGDLIQLLEWLQEKGVDLSSTQADHLHQFITDLAQNHGSKSLARKISTLRQFFNFCTIEKLLDTNPAEDLLTPSLPQRLPKYLEIEQVTQLLAAADQGLPAERGPTEALRLRNRAMVYLLYATGVRVSELVDLKSDQIETQEAYLKIRGKGDKERIAPFVPAAGERLAEYLEQGRPKLCEGSPHADLSFVFLNARGGPLTRQSLWKIIGQLALQAGITVPLSPHLLRHSFATHLLQSGISLRSLQMLLGHSDLGTTQIYTHLSPGHLKEAHKKHHPRGD